MAKSDKSNSPDKSTFQPKTSFEDYLTNSFNIEIYKTLTEDEDWQGLFEPLQFFNLLYEQIHFVEQNKTKPVTVKNHLQSLELEKEQHWYLIYRMAVYYRDSEDKQLQICWGFINDIAIELENELFPHEETEPKPEAFNFKNDQEAASKIENLQDRLHFLKQRKKEYDQYNAEGLNWDLGDKSKQYQLEIDHVQDLIKSQQQAKGKPMFLLSNSKKGSKIDLIRILNALYELRLITKPDGQIPSKSEFMQAFGDFIGEDLKGYHSNLSQAFQNQPLEANLKVFNQMIETTKKAHHTSK